MTYDLTALRARIPALAAGTAHFDGPGGTQMPRPVIEAISDALSRPLSIRGDGLPGERNAETLVVETRRAMADLLGADPAGIVLGRSATQLTYDFSRTLAGTWAPGDEVVVTRLDHDANIRPWVQAAERAGVTVRRADFDPATGELTADHIRAVLSARTRLVAVTAASNLIGTIPPITEIARIVHEAGALLYVDGVHYTAHVPVDVEALGADFFVCSPYKFLGPHHGVLAARPALLETLRPDKLLPSTDAVPERFELGTLPYEFLAGTRAAVDFLAGLAGRPGGSRRERLASAFEAVEEHEHTLRDRLEQGLAALDGVTVHSRAARRTPTLLITLDGHRTEDAYRCLAGRGVHAPSGNFYALEASRHLGLGDTGGLRLGLAPYTDDEDVDRLLTGLAAFLGDRGVRSTAP
ncbi:cysteine desulfurase-like protein [Streptomyces capillispiralis]|uniref:Cysteine desulfurase family protein (TIGR01976 family) n=1 Tax=Streptomyces capillispiralis TaxID=68182 RepID=A0A561T7Y8_9ACTN|nr:cysteine desulfurase-like protein [Streptomyces capillispiralis]TWF83227.1 cysteine desulfurase family protein (TIGR01976 family) [Streptomyces capillispiralis]GHH94535.1 cysteine desulfurase-like protein [Streptomyces capillispiralis]